MKRSGFRRLRAILTIVIVTVTLAVVALSGTVSAEVNNSVAQGFKLTHSTADSASTEITNDSQDAIFSYTKWEPGYTQIEYFELKNAAGGSFNYSFAFISEYALSDLAKVIDVYYRVGDSLPTGDRGAVLDQMTYAGTLDTVFEKRFLSPTVTKNLFSGTTASGKDSVKFAVALQMRSNAGNAYQNLSLFADDASREKRFHVKVTASPVTP